MSPNATHLLVAAALLAAPASLGVASQTEAIDLPGLQATDGQAEAETIETFSGEVPDDVTAGALDLRIDHGTVEVVGWQQDSYKLKVLEATENGSTRDSQTEVTFDETVEGDQISLSLVVDHRSATGLEVDAGGQSVGADGERAIVAYVPQNLTYRKVFACEGETSSTPDTELVSLSSDDACVETSQPSVVHGEMQIHGGEDDGLDVTWGLQALEGEKAQLRADNGQVQLGQVDFAQLGVETDNGAVHGTNVTAGELAAETDNGDIDLEADADHAALDTHNGQVTLAGQVASIEAVSDNGDVAVASPVLANGSIQTDNGAIDVMAQPAESGELDLGTDNGAIDVTLGHDEDVGYDAEVWTDNGDVDIRLVDETGGDTTDEAEEDYHYENHQSARTAGYEDLPIQLAITAHSDNGAVEIHEQTAGTSDEETDSSGSAGLAALR